MFRTTVKYPQSEDDLGIHQKLNDQQSRCDGEDKSSVVENFIWRTIRHMQTFSKEDCATMK